MAVNSMETEPKENNFNKLGKIDNEPSWITDLRNQYKKDKRISIIATIIFTALFVTFLLLTIFDKVEKEILGVIVYEMNPLWFIAIFPFLAGALISFLSFFINDSKITTVEIVDGYYVVGYGGGAYWSLLIEGVEVDSSSLKRAAISIDNVVLTGRLPNHQKINVILGPSVKNFMKVEKVNEQGDK